MAEYPINKGIGRPVEFKGLEGTVPLHLLRRSAGSLRPVRHPLHGRHRPVDMYRLRRGIVLRPRMADLRAERPVRRTRADEIGSGTEPSPIPYQPAADHPIYSNGQRKEETTMRNTSKMTTLENKFPLLAVEHGCIISKDADITVAFEVELPELYTVTGAEYEAIHGCWCKAIKVLPDFSVVHKQDWFIKERYKPELQKDDMSFL